MINLITLKENNMNIKETLLIALAGLVFLTLTGVAKAETYDREEVDGYLTHYYKTVQVQNRVANRTCQDVDVPIYSNTGKAQTGEVLGGAIIGGILGNQVGGGKGKDAATILGAILGADFANKKGGQQTIVGYKQVEQCEIINKVTWKQNPPRCTVTVEVPAMNNSLHEFILNKCPKLNDRFTITASYTLRLKR
jgi:uncharacterized protein YcfJ